MRWKLQWSFCWSCGNGAFRSHPKTWFDCHEIVRRGEVPAGCALKMCNYVFLCRACHEKAHGGELTKGMLAFLKKTFDPRRHNMKRLNRLAAPHVIRVERPPKWAMKGIENP